MIKLTERIFFIEFGVLFHQNVSPSGDIQIQKGSCGHIAKYQTKRCHFDTAICRYDVSPNTFPWTMRPLDNVRGHIGRGCINIALKIEHRALSCKQLILSRGGAF
jgi:hypothetical protein